MLDPSLPHRPIAADEVVGRTIVLERWRGPAFEFGDNALGKHLAQLDAPLVERADVPDGTLGEDAVFV